MNPRLLEIANLMQANPSEARGHIYHPLPFPEFQHLTTSSKGDSARRKWGLIRRALGAHDTAKSFRVLDVGANAGFYTFNFAKLGATVHAFEPHERYATWGRQIAEATELPVAWHNKPIEHSDLENAHYDVSLMLSVFQWMSDGDAHLAEATELLKSIAACSRVLFFELGCNHGKSAIHTNERPLGWTWRLLEHNTAPKQVAYLGSTTAWGRARRYLFACTDGNPKLTLTPWQQLVTFALRRGLLR